MARRQWVPPWKRLRDAVAADCVASPLHQVKVYPMTHFHYQLDDQVKTVQVERTGDAVRVTIGDRSYTVVAQSVAPDRMVLQIDGQQIFAVVATDGNRTEQHVYIWLNGDTWTLPRATGRRRRQTASQQDTTGSVLAPMPGQVLALLVAEGERVAPGDPLLVLGAMKMETRLTAPREGVVQRVTCAVGDTVERGQLLVQL